MNDLVSIITPLYNLEDYISETIESVINQSYKNWELIIIDDFSTDKSVECVKQYKNKDSRIILIKNPKNYGPAISRNNGLNIVKGRFICFLDSDDYWAPHKLENQVRFMITNNYGFTFSSYYKVINQNVTKKIIQAKKKVTYSDILKSNYIGCLTTMLDREKINIPIVMPEILKRQDHALWIKIIKSGVEAYGISEPLAYYRVRQNSVSSNKIDAIQHQWKLYRKVEKLSFYRSVYYMCTYSIHGLKKEYF